MNKMEIYKNIIIKEGTDKNLENLYEINKKRNILESDLYNEVVQIAIKNQCNSDIYVARLHSDHYSVVVDKISELSMPLFDYMAGELDGEEFDFGLSEEECSFDLIEKVKKADEIREIFNNNY